MPSPFKKLVRPATPSVHISDISKEQLARIVNDQGARIRMLDEWMNTTGRLLLAIAQEPEAFQFQDGRVTIDAAAIAKIKKGTQLKVEYVDGKAVLTVYVPEQPSAIEVPKIVMPPGVM